MKNKLIINFIGLFTGLSLGFLIGILLFGGSSVGTSIGGGGGGTSFGSDTLIVSRQDLTAATTTPCALSSPTSTSTTVSFSLDVSTGTSTDGIFTIGTSTTAYATTSNMFIPSLTVSSGTKKTITWYPKEILSGVVSPNTFIVVGVAGVSSGGFTYGGTCKALFNSVN